MRVHICGYRSFAVELVSDGTCGVIDDKTPIYPLSLGVRKQIVSGWQSLRAAVTLLRNTTYIHLGKTAALTSTWSPEAPKVK